MDNVGIVTEDLIQQLSARDKKALKRSGLALEAWAKARFCLGIDELIERKNAKTILESFCETQTVEAGGAGENIEKLIPLEKAARKKKMKTYQRQEDRTGELILGEPSEFSPTDCPEIKIILTKTSRPFKGDEAESHRSFFCKFLLVCSDFSQVKRMKSFSCVNCPQKNNPDARELRYG